MIFKHDYNEIKGTGKKFNVRGVDLFKINKGKIQENALYFDMFDLLHQMDAIYRKEIETVGPSQKRSGFAYAYEQRQERKRRRKRTRKK